MKTYTLITTRTALLITFIVITSTFGITYLFNIKSDHSLYENALFFLLFLAFCLFVFISCGLYYGAKLKDDIGKLTDHIDSKRLPDFGGGVPDISTAVEGLGKVAEGLGGLAFALLAAFGLLLLAWFFILSSWFVVVLLAAMLYWVYFRALRLVFKHSAHCKGNIQISAKYGFMYSVLYTSWVFLIIFGLHFLR